MELAQQHMRTRGAIRARLIRLGLINELGTTDQFDQIGQSISGASETSNQTPHPASRPKRVLSEEFLDAVIAICIHGTEEEILDSAYSALEGVREAIDDGALELTASILKKVTAINQYVLAAEEFKLALQDLPYAQDQTAADELVAWLQEIAAPLDQQSILFRRIDKEVRELLERRPALPTGTERAISRELAAVHRKLQNQAPTCGHRGCQQKMTLRDGKYGLFWGCITFSKCWGTKSLSKGQRG